MKFQIFLQYMSLTSKAISKYLLYFNLTIKISFCKLLPTWCSSFQGLSNFDKYFTDIDLIIRKNPISSRVRFMLQDLVDLRNSRWKPRRDVAGPKTIDQVSPSSCMPTKGWFKKIVRSLLRCSSVCRGLHQTGTFEGHSTDRATAPWLVLAF